eukprot:31217-Pelagococcus_subviridis.AAC.3
MRGDDRHLDRDAERFERLRGRGHRRKVAVGAHDDPDARRFFFNRVGVPARDRDDLIELRLRLYDVRGGHGEMTHLPSGLRVGLLVPVHVRAVRRERRAHQRVHLFHRLRVVPYERTSGWS